MILNATQVAAVIGARIAAVVGSGSRKVVARIAVGKAVRHDEIDHVAGTKAAEALVDGEGFSRGISLFEFPLCSLFPAGRNDGQRYLSGRGLLVDIQPGEEVMPVPSRLCATNMNAACSN